MSYNIPTKKNRNVIHFAVYTKHVGLYIGSKAIDNLQNNLKGYKTSKGTVRVDIDDAIPEHLIKKIIDFNLKNLSKPHV